MLQKKFLYLLTSLFLLLSLNGCVNSGSDRTDTGQSPVLLISVDGMMNKYIERNETPNFDRFLSEGVQAEYMIPVFPTKTFPNHWSLATGLYVENHGIISNSFYDYNLENRFSYGAPDGQHDERWWGGEPIWVTAEKQGKTSVNFFWPGSEATFDGMQSTKWVDYDGSIPDSTRIDSIAAWFNPEGEVQADFGTLYFSFVDSQGHRYGPDSPEVDEAVKEMDTLLGYFMEKMDEVGLSEELNMILVSDHGMAEQSEEKVIFLDEIINLDDVDMVDWSPVAMIRPNAGKTDEIYNALKENEENYRVYLKDEMPERFHFSNHYRIPEIIMIADISYSITTRENFEDRGVVPGMHGFDNMAPEMHTFFAAKGPAFKVNEVEGPVESVNIYELISHLLQIEPAENDGSLDAVKKFLKE
ncbi:alkaline phosphatase family protein [Rhodohalobacter sp.]|uniref:nucleotide pyrophosphatase/phosphodiesterase family protein n=1 Tax=Rhodohalobacter sp. TaxID=1974210 RepID=UPI002ACD6684|nr:alkaline phosphatase family protein [Rhodohalobacter sp.]MDZ7758471.1 alkaline phosphatase family protein [Rhodohalobacter sp.]